MIYILKSANNKFNPLSVYLKNKIILIFIIQILYFHKYLSKFTNFKHSSYYNVIYSDVEFRAFSDSS